ncbi:hypothetical protein HQQ94_07860 [Shewanella sp. VB17]|uniref:hypothetical protein n=1 Tax=Shewanella sp. VB17 TaxID=2739432 RepID=UPI00156445AE|nr:hypothetical protein [Shewanella sp. VB17]NRD73156.1 hypothetical protein [Shewanella sp. VB17]
MRHSSRQKHLKHLHRAAHIRRMCYFRTVRSDNASHSQVQDPPLNTQDLNIDPEDDNKVTK